VWQTILSKYQFLHLVSYYLPLVFQHIKITPITHTTKNCQAGISPMGSVNISII
jgi:hypothetical protein